MTPATWIALFVFVAALAAALLLLAGLCRAAADLRDVEPDNGEYHD